LPRSIFQAAQAFLKETLPPFTDDLTRQIKALANLFVSKPFRGQQDGSCAHDLKIR